MSTYVSSRDSTDVVAVIVTYNRFDELLLTLEAIIGEGIPMEKIIVINNHSTDPRYDSLTVYYPHLKHIVCETNLASAGGFAKGMMMALEMRCDWLWLFNDDSRPSHGALSSLKPFFRTSECTHIIKISNLDNNGMATVLFWKGVRKPVKFPPAGDLIPCDLVTFDGCLIHAQVVKTIGSCDARFFMGSYEFDFCLRALDAGFRIFTLPNGLLEDQKLGSINGLPPWREYYNSRNHLWMGLRNRSVETILAWFWRELKFSVVIALRSDQKVKRFRFKFRAIRDALMNRMGCTFLPE